MLSRLVVVRPRLVRAQQPSSIPAPLGSSLVDSTLSIGVGPVVAPADVTARLAVVGALYTDLAIATVGALLVARRRHDRLSAAALMGLYALSYAVLLGLGR